MPTVLNFEGGEITVPVRHSHFGDWCDLKGLIPNDCECIMVLVNSGGGLNAGFPHPVGFLKLSHQLYVKDLEKLLKEQWVPNGQMARKPMWITIVPVRTKEYVDVWVAEGVEK